MDNEKQKSITKKVTVCGIVQGVGFRPHIYHIAQKHQIFGTVRNIGGLVEIITQSSRQDFDDFMYDIEENKEKKYEIVSIQVEDYEGRLFHDFKIIDSDKNDEVAIIPPDLPVCKECQEELYRRNNRRFLNPFISCMSCGARYTIIEELPYDRDNTSMKDYSMCSACYKEYTSPTSRRFHAQTISCNECGPYLIFTNMASEISNLPTQLASDECQKDSTYSNCSSDRALNHAQVNKEAFETAVDIINSGGIIAVKGIGGYHFVCSPFQEDSVIKLRKLKGREEKPFAVMFESISSIREYCILSEEEKVLLESKARPIVLLTTTDKKMAPSTNKASIYCGAFLPYTPLQIMLTDRCGPLIMTSANISNKPIMKEDDEIRSIQSPYLQGVLYNTRRIVRSVDDSVAKIIDKKPQLIRRSRGYVPYPVFLEDDKKDIQIFAAGGDLKAAFCLYKKKNAVVSQYFGDLEEQTVLQEYERSVSDLSHLLKISPNIAVCDLHPNYYSVKYAKSLNIPVQYVQHHHAHIASVIAEHNLKGKVIGVAFDGTGYGMDGNIWGGEFFVCEGAGFTRVAHLSYTPILGGDNSMRDAKKTATCFLIRAGLSEYIKEEHYNIINAALSNNINTVLSSSMGRLFDAVASILDIQDENTYEGECASNLEKEAILAKRKNIKPIELTFAIKMENDMLLIDPIPVLKEICRHKKNAETGALALGFHHAVADLIVRVCERIRQKQNTNIVALSGGVFQNTVLTENVLRILREKDFCVYINKAVPPNDGCISLGQTYVCLKAEEVYSH